MLTLGGFLLCGWGDGGRDWAEWTSISQSEMGEPQRTIFLHFLGGKSKSSAREELAAEWQAAGRNTKHLGKLVQKRRRRREKAQLKQNSQDEARAAAAAGAGAATGAGAAAGAEAEAETAEPATATAAAAPGAGAERRRR